MVFTPFEQLYSAAMALNNMGVSLLERSCHDEAMEAFGDALSLIQEISVSPSSERKIPPSEVEAKIDKASHILARCLHNDKDDSRARFCIISQEDSTSAIRSYLQKNDALCSSEICLIRVELMATSLPNGEDYYPGLETSIILYNCGNAHMWLASTLDPTYERAARAFKLFQLSASILETLSLHTHVQDSDALMAEHLPITILVLRRLVVVTSMLCMTSDSQDYYRIMLRLQDKFSLADALNPYMLQCAAGAA
jgi:hypothetical protein